MENKLLVSTIFLGMIVASIGTASAFNLGIDGGGLVSIAPGSSTTLDLVASNFNPDTLNTEFTLAPLAVQCSGANTPPLDTNCRPDLITVTVNTPTFTPSSDPFPLPGSVTIASDAANPDPSGTKYIITLQSNAGETGGFAVASGFNLAIDKPGLVKLAPGSSMTLDMTVSGIDPSDFNTVFFLSQFSVDCSKLNPPPLDTSCNSGGVYSNIVINNSLDTIGFVPTSSIVKLPGAITITMPGGPTADPVGTQYIISIQGSSGASLAFPIASVDAQSIPEFPMIAAPVAAVIGIVFFFQRRKKND